MFVLKLVNWKKPIVFINFLPVCHPG